MNQFNDKGQKHGYWEDYWSNGSLFYKGNFINGERSGHWELYNENGVLDVKKFHL
jgi:antitoxin component YwqK of YwqJK toxin-antitoxin module